MLLQIKNFCIKTGNLISVAPTDLCWRIMLSLIPPVTSTYKKFFADLLGPTLAVILIILVLSYGNSLHQSVIQISPLQSVLMYIFVMPISCFLLNKMCRSNLTFLQIFSLIGYALYGHILTLVTSFLYYLEDSNAFFFICMIAFTGLSTFRVVLLQLQFIPVPAAGLIVCTFFSTSHLLFLMFIHFSYMHPSFHYVSNRKI